MYRSDYRKLSHRYTTVRRRRAVAGLGVLMLTLAGFDGFEHDSWLALEDQNLSRPLDRCDAPCEVQSNRGAPRAVGTAPRCTKGQNKPTNGWFERLWRHDHTQSAQWLPARPTTPQTKGMYEVTRFPNRTTPTAAQRRRAEALFQQSFHAACRCNWFERPRGLADGYKKMEIDIAHYVNRRFLTDGRILDPARPEFLMYYPVRDGWVLAGVMFLMPNEFYRGPQIGGPWTLWHYHVYNAPICFRDGLDLGAADADWSCPEGRASYRSPEMLHVWFIDHPGGRFGTDMHLSEAQIAESPTLRGSSPATGP